jgi:hypothetical protein
MLVTGNFILLTGISLLVWDFTVLADRLFLWQEIYSFKAVTGIWFLCQNCVSCIFCSRQILGAFQTGFMWCLMMPCQPGWPLLSQPAYSSSVENWPLFSAGIRIPSSLHHLTGIWIIWILFINYLKKTLKTISRNHYGTYLSRN